MPVVDVLQGSRLTESGVSQQALEPLIVAVGLLILHQQPHKLGMGELGASGTVKSLFKPPDHAKQLQRVESGYGLLVKHSFPLGH